MGKNFLMVILIFWSTDLYAQCTALIGEFGLPTGKKFCQYPDGSTYEGDMVGGKFSGRGEFTLPNGDIIQGSFRNGFPHGEGKLTLPKPSNLAECEGLYYKGTMKGKAKLKYRDGEIHTGQFLDCNPNGIIEYSKVIELSGVLVDAKIKVERYVSENVSETKWMEIFIPETGMKIKETYDKDGQRNVETILEGISIAELKQKREREKAKRENERKDFLLRQEEKAKTKERERVIYNNCIIDKMPSMANPTVEKAVKSTCKDISKKPSFFQKMRYGEN